MIGSVASTRGVGRKSGSLFQWVLPRAQLRIRADLANGLLDGFEDALGSERRDQPGSAGLNLGLLVRQPGDGDLDGARPKRGNGLLQDLRAGIVDVDHAARFD